MATFMFGAANQAYEGRMAVAAATATRRGIVFQVQMVEAKANAGAKYTGSGNLFCYAGRATRR